MDLKVFYQKIAHVRETISAPYAITVSVETPDGGRAGILTEVSREVAARLIVEARARLASDSEAADFHAQRAEALRLAEEREAQQRVQFTLLSEQDMQVLRQQSKRSKP